MKSTSTPRICNREGCTREVYARAKCVSHFNSMIKSLRRKGSTLFAAVDTWAELQKALPGTYGQLVERTGLAYGTIQITMKKKHAAGEVHVSGHLPPQRTGGARWVRVFAAGPGVDHVVTEARKKNYARRMRRESHARQRAAEKAQTSPVVSTRWNLAFFNPAAQFGARAA